MTNQFKQYRRKQIAELRPYQPGEVLTHVSISKEDLKAGSPKVGDMVARNPANHADQWLVAAAYFSENFEEMGGGTIMIALNPADEEAVKILIGEALATERRKMVAYVEAADLMVAVATLICVSQGADLASIAKLGQLTSDAQAARRELCP